MTDRNQATKSSSDAALTERAERLVRQEVHMCLSSLVSTLAQSYSLIEPRSAQWVNRREVKERLEALTSLQEQAFELSSPVLDYEEAARQAGWEPDLEEAARLRGWEPEAGPVGWRKLIAEHEYEYALSPEDACTSNDIEPYEWEIFEHWAVSEWFGRQLAAQGERVDFDFAGMVVWGRTTTGQGIAMDSVVRTIASLMATTEPNKEIV